MDDAFDLPDVTTVQESVVQAPQPSLEAHASVKEALQYLTQLKAFAMSFAGKNRMNPFLWIQERGIDKLSKALTTSPTTEMVEAALNIKKEEPNVNLFTHLYEPKPTPTPRR